MSTRHTHLPVQATRTALHAGESLCCTGARRRGRSLENDSLTPQVGWAGPASARTSSRHRVACTDRRCPRAPLPSVRIYGVR
jgi:hypothetical protein